MGYKKKVTKATAIGGSCDYIENLKDYDIIYLQHFERNGDIFFRVRADHGRIILCHYNNPEHLKTGRWILH